MSAHIDIDQIFREDSANPPSERTLPWEETRDGITVVVEPKPHWADDMRAFRLEARAYCRYADWTANGGHARFDVHIDTSGDDVMMSRVYRLQTDEGERIIGRRVSPTWAANRRPAAR